ncbi:hypothetical protein ACFOUR_14300 [Halovivax cerinus]|uniref:Uncharacterized protein n=1 Tax=Halovivax cerinus TaxID=1487865 RepID=A0ABD5NR85_9EURY
MIVRTRERSAETVPRGWRVVVRAIEATARSFDPVVRRETAVDLKVAGDGRELTMAEITGLDDRETVRIRTPDAETDAVPTSGREYA